MDEFPKDETRTPVEKPDGNRGEDDAEDTEVITF